MYHIRIITQKNGSHDMKQTDSSIIIVRNVCVLTLMSSIHDCSEFLKFIGPRGQKIMRSANNDGNAGPHVRQTFLNDVFTFLTEVGNAGGIVNTGTSSVNSEFVTALNT